VEYNFLYFYKCLSGLNEDDLANRWMNYLGITDAAPSNTVSARIQFSSSFSLDGFGVDKVFFARLV
jgi:hypothetical protein